MPFFRKKPVVIEAMRYEGGKTTSALLHWVRHHGTDIGIGLGGKHLTITTLEGEMRADIGDWIIKGVKGEFYPCKPDIFAATYEAAAKGEGEGR